MTKQVKNSIDPDDRRFKPMDIQLWDYGQQTRDERDSARKELDRIRAELVRFREDQRGNPRIADRIDKILNGGTDE